MSSGKFGGFGLDLASKPFEKWSFCKGNPAETSAKSPIFSRLRRANKNKVKRTIYTIDSGRRRRPKIFELNPPCFSPFENKGGLIQGYGLISLRTRCEIFEPVIVYYKFGCLQTAPRGRGAPKAKASSIGLKSPISVRSTSTQKQFRFISGAQALTTGLRA